MEWTNEEMELLFKYYEKNGPTYLTKLISRGSKSISNKARKLGLKFDSSTFYKSYEFDRIVKNSRNLVDICRNLNLKLTGGNRNTIKKWIKIKNLDTSHFFIERKSSSKKDDSDIFIENSKTDRRIIKNRLYNEGLKGRICEMCGQDENWFGKKISLILDHINGINDDNRIENLRILCPNCNSTLDTHGGKNIKNKLKQVIK